MPIKNLTLGLGLLIAGSAVAQHPTFRTSHHSDYTPSGAVPRKMGLGYVVRSGENNWIIAHRHHLTIGQLKSLNPGIDLTKLHAGQSIHISGVVASMPRVASKPAPTHVAKAASKAVVVSSSANYTVRDGDNDWIIAHRHGASVVALRRANPGVNLARMRTGQKIRIPASWVSKPAPYRLHSRYAVINGDNVNIRRDPGTSGDSITQVDSGTRVVVLDRDGDWYRLRFPRGTEGWVRAGLLKAVAEPKRAKSARRSRDEDDSETRVATRARRRPTVVASRSHSLKSHVAVGTVSDSGPLAVDISDDDAGGKILQKAQSMRGVRYRWGAMSRSATDCSGFTSQVFRGVGYKIPRTSQEQANAGQAVHSKDLKPGDLVFFHTMRGARVTHVGIYMGKGKFIHASSAGGHVQVNRLDEGYYRSRLVGARRVATLHHSATPPVEHSAPKVTSPASDVATTLPTPDGG